MALVELRMPKMGESIIEATIINWLKGPGEQVEADETILEVATDKVDSEIPSPVKGVLREIKYPKDTTVAVGEVLATIQTEAEESSDPKVEIESIPTEKTQETATPITEKTSKKPTSNVEEQNERGLRPKHSDRFYSPLVRNIAAREHITKEELDQIPGTGLRGRLTKTDLLNYIDQKTKQAHSLGTPVEEKKAPSPDIKPELASSNDVEIVEMSRMRRLIADHMVMSKQTSPHVSSFVEADVTNMVLWRSKIKDSFLKKHGQKISFTPLFVEAVVKALQDFPWINVSVEGNTIVRKKYINIGMATALPDGNLIVPVIKNADHLNLIGLTQQVNQLVAKARSKNLAPDEIQDGTFTLTNVGTFGNIMGTPIINQPQVAILATGVIRKKPVVLETNQGDVIAIRHMMYLSLSYDHRVVDGFMGGSFLKRVAEYMEGFDVDRSIG